MKRLLCFFLLLGLLPVFAPACTHYYVRPGSNKADFKRDKAECGKIAERESRNRGTRVCDETERCLEAKGWRRD